MPKSCNVVSRALGGNVSCGGVQTRDCGAFGNAIAASCAPSAPWKPGGAAA